MNVGIGTAAAQFLSGEYLFRIFGITSLQWLGGIEGDQVALVHVVRDGGHTYPATRRQSTYKVSIGKMPDKSVKLINEVILHMYINKKLTHKNYMLKHPFKFCSLTCIFLIIFAIQLLQHAVCECVYVCTVHFHTLSHQYLYSVDAYTWNFANTTAWQGSVPLCF
jgi:hypothetical protein